MSSIDVNLPPEQSPPDAKELHRQSQYRLRVQKIADAVRKHQCILFLGSAIHAPSVNPKYFYPPSKCPPFGDQLSELLAKECGYSDPDRDNLQRVSRFYEFQSGFRRILVDAIRTALHTETLESLDSSPEDTLPTMRREPSPVLCGLARLKFPIVITTNYDQLYERALEQVAEQDGSTAEYDRCIYSPDGAVATMDCEDKPSADRPYLLKIHGDVDQIDSIVVTDEDYLHFVLRMGDLYPYKPVGKNVHTYLTKWPTLFIGYRLSDYNLRLLIKTLRWKMTAAQIPASYSVDLKPDVLIRDALEKNQYVSFIEKNLWDFVPDLYHEVTRREMPI